MLKMIEFRTDQGRFQCSIHAEEQKMPRAVAIVLVRTDYPKSWSGAGVAVCSKEDPFDIRVGVPLALKRALHELPGVRRPEVMRAFFQQWPEAHPEHTTEEEKAERKRALKAAQAARAEMIRAAVAHEISASLLETHAPHCSCTPCWERKHARS